MLAAVYVVDSLADNTNVDGMLTLREAILAAETDTAIGDAPAGSGADTIVFADGLQGTIALSTTGNTTNGSSAFGITTPITVLGNNGASGIVIDAGGTRRHFFVSSAGNLTFDSLTLTGGLEEAGGAIHNNGSLTVSNSTLTGNTAGSASSGNGGAVYNLGGMVDISNSTISGNTAVSVPNSGASTGGGVFTANGDFRATNVTIANNVADIGGGVRNTVLGQVRTVSFENSILANSTGDDLSSVGGTIDARNSLVESGSEDINGANVGNIFNVDPELAPLSNNGGLTQTHLPAFSSPVIDQGDNGLANVAGLSTDQRSLGRFFGTIDIGAVEIQEPVRLVVSTLVDEDNGDFSAGDLSLREAIGLAQARTAAEITFDPALTASGDATLDLTAFTTNAFERSAFVVSLSTVVIQGPTGPNGITLRRPDTAGDFRFFHITNTGQLRLHNLTLSGGVAQGGNARDTRGPGGGGGGGAGMGGGILNQGLLTLERVTLTGNQAVGGHGGFANPGNINGPGSRGGGATGGAGGELNGRSPGFPGGVGGFAGGGGGGGGYGEEGGNSIGGAGGAGGFGGGGGGGGQFFLGGGNFGAAGAGGFGGGTAVQGDGGGGAGMGGAVFNEGRLIVSNSTFSGNSATGGQGGRNRSPRGGSNAGSGLGGAIFSRNGNIDITHATIAANTVSGLAADGGGVYSLGDGASAFAFTASTIVADSTGSTNDFIATTNAGGSHTSFGDNNLMESQSGFAGSVVITADPQLSPLSDNGGPSATHALAFTSPAVDAGGLGGAGFDQRGDPYDRLSGAQRDIGAFEFQVDNMIVSTLSDVADNDFSSGQLSLREAIQIANTSSGASTITFSNTLSGGTINLASSLPTIADDLTITGLGSQLLTIDAGDGQDNTFGTGDGYRVFIIDDQNANLLDVEISGLTLTGGDTGSDFNDNGAAIRNLENLTLRDVVLTRNSAGQSGGGLQHFTGLLNIIDSTLSANQAGIAGGGLSTFGTANVLNSTIANNAARRGAGLASGNSGTLNLTNSTVSGNMASEAGGGILSSSGLVNIDFSTVTDNNAGTAGAALYGGSPLDDNGVFALNNSIIAGSVSSIKPITGNYNLFSQTVRITGTGNLQNMNPNLRPLQDNGGPTLTHALRASSPAINAGDPTATAGVGNVPSFDQRGTPFGRVERGRVDMGALERDDTLLSFTRLNPNSQTTNANTLVFRATFGRDVTSVDASDFLVDSTSTATVTNVLSIDARRYDITVSGGDLSGFNGTVGLNVSSSNSITDLGGTAFMLVEPEIDEVYQVDNSLLIDIRRHNPASQITNADTLVFEVNFNESVADFSTSDFIVTGGTTAQISLEITMVNQTTYRLTVLGGDLAGFNGTVGIDLSGSNTIVDLLGNTAVTGVVETYTVDNITLIDIRRHNPASQITNADTLVFEVNFSDPVVDFSTSDFIVTGGTTAQISLEITMVNQTTYRLTVLGGDLAGFNGTAGIDLSSSNTIVDLLGNTAVTGVVETYMVDNIAPRVTAFTRSNPSIAFTSADALAFQAMFNETVSGVGTGDFSVDGETTALTGVLPIGGQGAAIIVAGGDLATFTGTVGINISPTNDITDLAGNPLSLMEPETDESFTLVDLNPIVVSSLADTVDEDFSAGELTLREAILYANSSPGADNITFSNSLSGGTIKIGSQLPPVSDGLTIRGLGSNSLTIDAGDGTDNTFGTGDGYRIFLIGDESPGTSTSFSVEISGLTLTGGDSRAVFEQSGGAIFSNQPLVLRDVVFLGNATGFDGGGLYTRSQLSITDSSFQGNQAGGLGGGGFFAGALNANIATSTFAENSARAGGGIFAATSNSTTITNVTVSNNTATESGGGIIGSRGVVRVNHSTVATNLVGLAEDAIGGFSSTFEADFELNHSVVAGSANLTKTPIGNYNLFSQTILITGTGNLQNRDPKLGPLQNNGGPTRTRALALDSPAINAGDPNAVASQNGVPQFDQRGIGFGRVVGGGVDIGAFEVQPPSILDVVVAGSGWADGSSGGLNFIDAVDGGGIGAGNGLGYSLVGLHQLAALPWVGVNTIYLHFNEDVSASIDASDVRLTGANGGNYALGTLSYGVDGTNVLTIPVSDGIRNDRLVLSVFDGTVTDALGNALDGEWTSGQSAPSGNTTAGGRFDFFFNVLVGDADRSGQVDAGDITPIGQNFLQAANGPFEIFADLDASGQIDAGDITPIGQNFLNNLLAVSPPTPPAAPVRATGAGSRYAALDTFFAKYRGDPLEDSLRKLRKRHYAFSSFEPELTVTIDGSHHEDSRLDNLLVGASLVG